jgi:PilZ domain
MRDTLRNNRAAPPSAPPDRTDRAERRALVRFRCERACTTGRFITNTYRTLPAQLVDISPQGLGLLLDQPLPMGTRLNIEFEDDTTALPIELLAEIVNVTAQADGSWRCGCTLVWRISEAEMWLLLKNGKV